MQSLGCSLQAPGNNLSSLSWYAASRRSKARKYREPIFYNFQLDLHVLESFNRGVVCSHAIASLQLNATDENDLVGKLILQLGRSGIGQDYLQWPISRK